VPNRNDTAAERKLKAAERKAAKLLEDARREADLVRAAADDDAARTRAEAEERARGLVIDASATAEGVRAEGMELVSNLREMGDVLRANAERLLHDIQDIHLRMVSELERVDPGGGVVDSRPDAEDQASEPAPSESEELDVPDFIGRG
jgi:hypothetical protein